MTVAAFTLGCKVNQYDTDSILKDFSALGFTICDFESKADVYLINTCTVTNISDKKSRQMINRAYKRNPAALIIAYGCYAKVAPHILKELQGVSLVLGPDQKKEVAQITIAKLQKEKTIVNTIEKSRGIGSEGQKRIRAYLKIQDGCDRYCSYCIVPYARGGSVSRDIEDTAAEAELLIENGYKEIILTGIQIAAYGNDLNRLIKRIHDIPGLCRLRLGSLAPDVIDEEFLKNASNLPKLCDHFHISLQSGCDRILASMNRKYTAAEYAGMSEAVRAYFPKAALTTDIIVGFPGETEEDFDETLKFAEKIGFFRIHVFVYSPKENTAAAKFTGQLDIEVKERRSRILRDLAERMNYGFYRQNIKKTFPVLFESEFNGFWEGHTTQYMTVRVHSKENLCNHIIPVTLKEYCNGVVYGEIYNGG